MVKPAFFTSRISLGIQRPKPPMFLTISSPFAKLHPPRLRFPSAPSSLQSVPFTLRTHFSTTATPYPLQYDMIISRPAQQPAPARRRIRPNSPKSLPNYSDPGKNEEELGFDDWVDRKLNSSSTSSSELAVPADNNVMDMDRSKKKYYKKRRKRMYGSDSEDENSGRDDNESIELKQEVVELRTLHKREEELYFYDAFAYPWEKDKHYKMVYQLEKKYFPDQSFDKAFLEPGQSNKSVKQSKKRVKGTKEEEVENKGSVFFDDEDGKNAEKDGSGLVKGDVSEKKVEEFFKCLKKVPNKDTKVASNEPFLSSRSIGLPHKWDSRGGTVVLINKPKGWTSFTVCGKLRRLIKAKKVGHTGTLDPMATGLLIVCVGKATKLTDWYQGLTKGYSGIFRLGEATSTLDADSPIIQREPWEHIKDEDIKKAAASFCGEIWQVPPMFSAIKVGGEKLYEKARRGESIELSPRRVSIFQFDVERSLDDRQNVMYRVTCSKGTYIRSLCADFGKALGSCAHLVALRRDSIGEYSADDAWEFQELEEAITKDYM